MLVPPILLKKSILFFNTRLFSSLSKAYIDAIHYTNYFEPRLHTYDDQARKIITLMGHDNPNKSELSDLLEGYLQLHSHKRMHAQLIALLCATSLTNDSLMKIYRKRIIELIIRTPSLEKYQCDEWSLEIVIKEFVSKRSESLEKIKESLVKNKATELIKHNIDAITVKNMLSVANLLLHTERNQVTGNTRYLTLANILHLKFSQLFQKVLNNEAEPDEQKAVTFAFINNLLKFYRDYPPKSNKQVATLYEIISHKLSEAKWVNSFHLHNIHRCFPYTGKNHKGQYYKDLVLLKVLEHKKKLEVSYFLQWHQGLLSYSILSFEFYKFMNEVAFRYEGSLNYLNISDLVKPELPAYFWQIYNKNPQLINKDHITKNIIKDCYPQKYRSTPQVQSSTILPPKSNQNQIGIRFDAALQLLGLKRKKEIEVCGRFVDFLLADNIIIECDGDYHFNVNEMDYDEDTQFRNLHLLLSGYRLVIFNIFQYNSNRDVQSLARLITKKLQCLSRNDAIIVL